MIDTIMFGVKMFQCFDFEGQPDMPETQKLCKTCQHFDAKSQECRRYAPRPVTVTDQKNIRWPIVQPINWCSEFTVRTA